MLQKGERIFFCTNIDIKQSIGYNEVRFGFADRLVESLGLSLDFYVGVGLRAIKSILNREILDSYHQSKVLVLLIAEHQGRSIEDNWAMPRIEEAVSSGKECLIYVTAETPQEKIQNLNLPVEFTVVNDKDHFEDSLKKDLSRLMNKS
ncbi:hypothetical protein CMI38_04890 [Candidatus Pacearchaeota archaeon]|nr:hypothetical protein [Candidatus Pacearchaeota archaeon]